MGVQVPRGFNREVPQEDTVRGVAKAFGRSVPKAGREKGCRIEEILPSVRWRDMEREETTASPNYLSTICGQRREFEQYRSGRSRTMCPTRVLIRLRLLPLAKHLHGTPEPATCVDGIGCACRPQATVTIVVINLVIVTIMLLRSFRMVSADVELFGRFAHPHTPRNSIGDFVR